MSQAIYSNGVYRSRNGVLFGVCGGLADYLDISSTWTRIFTLVAFLLTGFFPVGVVYLALALLLKKAPLMPSGYDASWEQRLWEQRTMRSGSFDDRLRRVQDAIN